MQMGTEGNVKPAILYEYEPALQSSLVIWFASIQAHFRQPVWFMLHGHEGNLGEPHLRGMSVSVLGRDVKIVEDILEEGRVIQQQKRGKYLSIITVYNFSKGLGWYYPRKSDHKQPGRPISSVILPSCSSAKKYKGDVFDQATAVLEDCREFLESEAWYVERGIPYRRGYLLHGVPGSGKSSLVNAVATELGLPIYLLQLSSELIPDETLARLLQEMGDPPTLLLIEDIVRAHPVVHGEVVALSTQRVHSKAEQAVDSEDLHGRGKLTLSGLLNALDGPTASTGRLLFLTTSHKHKLDPALIRSGRIDYEVEFLAADDEQVQRLVKRLLWSHQFN